MKESGYDGPPVVVLHITDTVSSTPPSIVTRQRLESIGFKVILKAMDWSTNLVVRARKEPPDKGGWNMLHTWWMDRTSSTPRSTSACRAPVRAPGSAGRTFRNSRSSAPTGCAPPITKRKQLADEIQGLRSTK